MKKLVFIHGRAQENKDAAALKAEWIAAWDVGLRKSGLSMPIAETDIRFPYYGDTLADLAAGKSSAAAAAVIVKSMTDGDQAQREFIRTVLREIQQQRGIADSDIADAVGRDVTEKGVLNWGWVQDILEALDRRVPYASGASVALATHDVYCYLEDSNVRMEIENGVREALSADIPTVVVSHSLGTVVAYDLIGREGIERRWNVPLFVTLGSPLAVNAIRKKLAPNRHPPCVDSWYNAFDPRDVVALFPLDAKNFPVDPAIVNNSNIDNLTPNRHGISGYLSDADVARTIHTALGS